MRGPVLRQKVVGGVARHGRRHQRRFTSTMFNRPAPPPPNVNSSESPGRKKPQQQTGFGKHYPAQRHVPEPAGEQRAQQFDEPLGLVSDRRNSMTAWIIRVR